MGDFLKGYTMSDIDYWLWLSLKEGMTAAKMQKLFTCFSNPKEIFDMSGEDFSSYKLLDKRTIKSLSDKSLKKVTQVKDLCRKHDIKILTFDSPNYPDNLKLIPAPPYVLYTKSTQAINLNAYIRIAIVGNRESTDYGEKIAKDFGYNLANNGIVVVSGMARGIDSAAHRGCLEAGGLTVAVLGCGIDIPYPKENKGLMEQIVKTGIVISEYPPGSEPLARHFPERNRIISGLSQGTLVVEAPSHSGSLITARYALDQDRDLFAVPGDITKERSAGTNNLLKEFAIPVTGARDIFDYYSFEYTEIANIKKVQKQSGIYKSDEYKERKTEEIIKETKIEVDLNSDFYKDLSDSEKHIIKELSDEPVNFEKLLILTHLSAPELASMITMLELKGKVKTHPGKNFTLNTQ